MLIDSLRHQARLASYLAVRDLPKKSLTAIFALGIVWYTGARVEAMLVGLAILLIEAVKILFARIVPEKDEDVPIWMIGAVWLFNGITVALFLSPGFFVVHTQSTAMMLCGFMMCFATTVHVTRTYALFPHFNISLTTLCMLVCAAYFYTALQYTYNPSPPIEWTLSAVALVGYTMNIFETLWQHKRIVHSLGKARRQAQSRLEALEFQTRHDPLTGVLNRVAFDHALENMIAKANRKHGVAVIIMDLDGFKPINDSYSHEAGDRILTATAERLKKIIGKRGIVGRMGGDEFMIAIGELDTAADVIVIAREICDAVTAPVEWENSKLSITASVGVALTQDKECSVTLLCNQADQAMYKAKANPTGAPVLYSPGRFTPRPTPEEHRIARAAIDSGAIVPFFQPKVELATGRIIGFESLARWRLPDGSIQPAGKFISRLHTMGLQSAFGRSVTRQTMEIVSDWVSEGLNPGQVSLNLQQQALATFSGRKEILSILQEYPDALPYITAEVTEDIFISRSGGLIRSSLKALRKAGMRISLDDFGTGYSSFSHLKELEFDEIKIDKSFVADMMSDKASIAVIDGMLSIAEHMAIEVIAEGVETVQQRDCLIEMGCHKAQGFLWDQAIPPKQARQKLISQLPYPWSVGDDTSATNAG